MEHRRTLVGRPGTHLQLLGDWRLDQPDGPAHLMRRERSLVSLLALEGSRPRSYLAGTLWPEVTEARARANLRQSLARIRDKVPSLITGHGDSLELDPGVSVDVEWLREACSAVLSGCADMSGRECIDALQAIVGPELLLGELDEWVIEQRSHLQRQRLLALDVLSATLAERLETTHAIAACEAAIAIEPLREAPVRLVMALHLRAGNRIDAVRAYHALSERLHAELQTGPSPDIEELIAGLQTCGAAGLTPSTPRPRPG